MFIKSKFEIFYKYISLYLMMDRILNCLFDGSVGCPGFPLRVTDCSAQRWLNKRRHKLQNEFFLGFFTLKLCKAFYLHSQYLLNYTNPNESLK